MAKILNVASGENITYFKRHFGRLVANERIRAMDGR